MKKTAQIILLIFVTFLVTPTVICAIEKKMDVSCFYDFSEEEQEQIDIKIAFHPFTTFDLVFFSNLLSQTILSKNIVKHDTISLGIFVPPPELI